MRLGIKIGTQLSRLHVTLLPGPPYGTQHERSCHRQQVHGLGGIDPASTAYRAGCRLLLATQGVREDLLSVAIDAGAENIEEEDDVFLVFTKVEDFDAVRSALEGFLRQKREKPEKKWGESDDERPILTRSEVLYLPKISIELDAGTARKVLGLIDDLEDHDDIQSVYSDIEISDELLSELETES